LLGTSRSVGRGGVWGDIDIVKCSRTTAVCAADQPGPYEVAFMKMKCTLTALARLAVILYCARDFCDLLQDESKPRTFHDCLVTGVALAWSCHAGWRLPLPKSPIARPPHSPHGRFAAPSMPRMLPALNCPGLFSLAARLLQTQTRGSSAEISVESDGALARPTLPAYLNEGRILLESLQLRNLSGARPAMESEEPPSHS
jgi:hypothetical protein